MAREKPPVPQPARPDHAVADVATVVCIAACAVLIAWNASELMIGAGIVMGGTAFVLSWRSPSTRSGAPRIANGPLVRAARTVLPY